MKSGQTVLTGSDGLRFSCTLCGDCCTGNQVIRLSGGDLVLLVRRLGLGSVADLRTQGLVSLVPETAGPGRKFWRPRIRFRSQPVRQCPFLINDAGLDGSYRGLCSLHPEFKPLVCTLAPLAREVDDPGVGPVDESWSFVPPVDGCPGVGLGPVMEVSAPSELRSRLDDEVRWMRRWIDEAETPTDEDGAWGRLVGALG